MGQGAQCARAARNGWLVAGVKLHQHLLTGGASSVLLRASVSVLQRVRVRACMLRKYRLLFVLPIRARCDDVRWRWMDGACVLKRGALYREGVGGGTHPRTCTIWLDVYMCICLSSGRSCLRVLKACLSRENASIAPLAEATYYIS